VSASNQSNGTTLAPTGLANYTRAAEAACNQVISSYSTSFGWATRLLGKSVRQQVKNIYAMVRVADEIVDGAAAEAKAQGGHIDPARALDAYEAAVYQGLEDSFSTDLVLHAFCRTANECGFGRELIEPFFASMRADLTEAVHDQASFERYVYGSAEVVGLMCLAAFIKTSGQQYSREQKLQLAAGARALGSAFQKVNFLRDLAADFNALGRSYFPSIEVGKFTDADRDRLVGEINNEIAIAAAELPHLPSNSTRAVNAALLLFAELNNKIAQTPAAQIATTRIRVPNARKIVILLQAYFSTKTGSKHV
jgi:phytoene/squalene synthetase